MTYADLNTKLKVNFSSESYDIYVTSRLISNLKSLARNSSRGSELQIRSEFFS